MKISKDEFEEEKERKEMISGGIHQEWARVCNFMYRFPITGKVLSSLVYDVTSYPRDPS